MNACGLSNKIIDKTNINEQKKDFFQEKIKFDWLVSTFFKFNEKYDNKISKIKYFKL